MTRRQIVKAWLLAPFAALFARKAAKADDGQVFPARVFGLFEKDPVESNGFTSDIINRHIEVYRGWAKYFCQFSPTFNVSDTRGLYVVYVDAWTSLKASTIYGSYFFVRESDPDYIVWKRMERAAESVVELAKSRGDSLMRVG